MIQNEIDGNECYRLLSMIFQILNMIIKGKWAASNFVYAQGIELDTHERRFRRVFLVLGFIRISASWEPLQKIDYVLLFKTLYAKCEPCELESFENSSMIQLSLVYRKNRRLIIHESRDMAAIKDLALELAHELKVNVRDSASNRRKPTWIRLHPVGLPF